MSSMTSIVEAGMFVVQVIDEDLSTKQAYEYVDGKRTENVRRSLLGDPMFSLSGACYLLGKNEVHDKAERDLNGYIYLTHELNRQAEFGEKLTVKGYRIIRPASGNQYGLVTTIVGKVVPANAPSAHAAARIGGGNDAK